MDFSTHIYIHCIPTSCVSWRIPWNCSTHQHLLCVSVPSSDACCSSSFSESSETCRPGHQLPQLWRWRSRHELLRPAVSQERLLLCDQRLQEGEQRRSSSSAVHMMESRLSEFCLGMSSTCSHTSQPKKRPKDAAFFSSCSDGNVPAGGWRKKLEGQRKLPAFSQNLPIEASFELGSFKFVSSFVKTFPNDIKWWEIFFF